MSAHMLHSSGGPCWSRELGYHQPEPLPDAFWTQRHKVKQWKRAAKRKEAK
jgi:hypothetical protein